MIQKKIFILMLLFYSVNYLSKSQIVDYNYDYGTKQLMQSLDFYDYKLLKQSEEIILNSWEKFPNSPLTDVSAVNIGKIQFLLNNPKIADARLEEFVRLNPTSPFTASASLYRAFIAFENKDYSKSATLFKEAQEISGQDYSFRKDSIYGFYEATALYWEGISLCEQGKYLEAKPVFLDCSNKYPIAIYADDAYYAIGQIEELNRNYDSAISYFSIIERKYQFSNVIIAAKVRKANNLLVLRQATSGLMTIEETDGIIRKINENDTLYNKTLKNTQKPITNLYEPQTYSTNATEELMYLRGEAYNLSGNYDKAALTFDAFLETFTGSKLISYARLGDGWAYLNKHTYDKAIQQYDIIITSNDSADSRIKSTAQLYHTIALKRKGDTDKARKELTALSIQPDNPLMANAMLELGQIYYETQDYENANKTLERAEREATDALVLVRVHILLGATNMELHHWQKAISEYKLAEQLATKSSQVFMPQKDLYIAESKIKQGIALVKNYKNSEAIPTLLSFISSFNKHEDTDEAMFWLAEAYYRSDMLKNSIEIYNNILRSYPNSVRREESYYGLGWSYFRLKDFKKSSETFNQMIENYPHSEYELEVLARQADGYYVLKDYKNAAETYRRAARLAPKTEEGQYCAYQLCHALYRQGVYEDAISSLMDFVKSYSRASYSPYALYLIGWIRFQQKHYKEAIDNFTFLIQAYPQSDLVVRAHYTIADAYYNSGDYEKAISEYKDVMSLYPNSELAPDAMQGLQYCLLALGRQNEAVQIADTFISTNPKSPFAPEFKFKKAELFYNGKNYKDAISEYDDFMKKYPDSEKNPEAMYWMGKSYVNMDDPEKAEQMFTSVAKKYPETEYAPQALLEHALLKKQLNDIAAADSLFKILQEKYPKNSCSAQAGFERAYIKYQMGDTVSSIKLYREVADNFPNESYGWQSLFQIAMCYRTQSMSDSARSIFMKIMSVSQDVPLSAESQFRIGELWMRDKDFEKAIDAFLIVKDKYAGYEDWFTLSLLSLGECYENINNTEQARIVYEQVSTIRTDDDFGKTAKRRLKVLQNK